MTSSAPSPALPGVPPIAATVPGFDAVIWNGMGRRRRARRRMQLLDTLNRAVTASLAEPAVMAKFANLGSVPKAMTPAEFGQVCRRRHREMGQGHPGGQHYGRLTGQPRGS